MGSRQMHRRGRSAAARLGTLLLTATAVLACQPALAQDPAQNPDEQEALQDTDADPQIVVTGTRIQNAGLAAPSPVTSVGRDRLDALAATNVGEVLSQLPSFRASTGPSATQTNPGNTVGSRVLELRGLGPERTLLLVDGRRFVPTTAQGTVDANYIPSILLDRVEVVTGGASAAYGSDAVAGVVNFLLDTDLQGIRAEVQAGISERGDDATRFASLAGGLDFADGRGHVMIAGEYEDNGGLGECYTARDLCAEEYSLLGNTTPGSGGYAALNRLSDIHTALTAPGGVINSGPLRGTQFDESGNPVPFQYGVLPGLFQQGGSGDGENAFLSGLLLKVPVERWSVFGDARFDISDGLSATVQASYGEVSAYSVTANLRDTGSVVGNIKRDNAFLPASIGSRMDAAGITTFVLGRSGIDIGNAQGPSQSTAWRIVGALKGDITERWRWDAYYQYGRSTYYQEANNNVIRANIAQAVDAVRAPDGSIVCRSTLAAPGNGCQPFNIFGENQFSPQALDYITGTSFLDLQIEQHVAALNVQGELFDLWAGPLSVAAGYEFRNNSVAGTSDPRSQTGGFYVSNYAASDGAIEVHEGYVETVVPLLSDSAVGDLELNGAVRRTDYSTSGAVTTWKVGAVYEPIPEFRLRATRSRDIRAPNVTELFGSVTRSFSSFTDPVDSTQSLIEIVSGASAELQPETADTWTVGAVFQPGGFISGASLTVDYYDIAVDGAIGQVGAQTIANRCAAGAIEFCPLITRNDAGQVSLINDVLQNVNGLKTRGLDIEASYRTGIAIGTDLDLRLLATKVFELTTVDSAGSTDRAGQTGFRASTTPGVPDWIVDGIVTLDSGPFSISTHGRYIPEGSYNVDFVGPQDEGFDITLPNSINDNRVGDRFYTDLTLTWRVEDGPSQAEFFLAANNLFDVDPPPAPSALGMTNQVLFDQIGRRYRVGVRLRR